MPGIALPFRARLRLDRHQRAREADIPRLSVLVGSRAAAVELWRAWLGERRGVCVDLDDGEPLARRLLGALLEGRAVEHDVAELVARATGEPASEVEGRLRVLGRPERTALLEHAGAASGLPEVARLAGELLEDAGTAVRSGCDMDTVVTWLQIPAPEARPAILVATSMLGRALTALQTITERLPQLPVALAVEQAELDRFLTSAGSARDCAMVHEGVVRLDDGAATAARPGPSPDVEALRTELTALCEASSATSETAERARSVAERLLFRALEEHPVTRGRFELNARMEFSFGNRRAEIDLLSRRDGVAIEIDGYYHFVDADAYRRDRRKDVLLQRRGLFVLRFLAQDVGRVLDEIIDIIVDVLNRPPPAGASV